MQRQLTFPPLANDVARSRARCLAQATMRCLLVLLMLSAGPAARAQTTAKLTQSITFPGFSPTVNFVAGDEITLAATASSGLPVTYSSSNPAVAIIDGSVIRLTGIGTTTITALQAGNAQYEPATSVSRPLTVQSLGVAVLYADGDGNPTNNVIRPHLVLANNSSRAGLLYQDLTIRYWLTVENDAGLNALVTFAALGNNQVKARYVRLTQPRNGALGYVEYTFATERGTTLRPGSNSGPIWAQLTSPTWSALNETDDYSYRNQPTYAANDHITLYWNGRRIWGEEPAEVPPVTQLRVLSSNPSATPTANVITTYLELVNEGNVPVNYADLKVRYWFTPDGPEALNFTSTFAKLGSSNINGQFTRLSAGQAGASAYLELRFSPTLGQLSPRSSTGNIQYRINKSNWSAFNEADDYSYRPAGPLAPNEHITLYYQDQLVYGQEPPAASTRQVAGTQIAPLQVTVLGNPVVGEQALLEISGSQEQPLVLTLLDWQGQPVLTQRLEPAALQRQTLALPGLRAGVYALRVSNGQQMSIVRLLKQ
ncbi:T9SS C-terminal target domain-containing protein [Hymenobacter sediminis]|uniref:cellulose binding domain-containing protein n=1 Tax=Hymenobacter sediminis TaxID=2218621 RepID=UPI000DA6CBA6|nr:cellulose binding domain-containing protein [Hymenobacter sediminis]RPD44897.1 T9SS C-terminal target domain-containing protein [Hymenobacter sediminis]